MRVGFEAIRAERDAGWAERLGRAFSHVGNLAEMLDGMNIRVVEETNTLGRPGRREGGVRGDSAKRDAGWAE